jgi:3-hydroxyisobutyrate dehydrogenase-like beta-hydroxyacid dehydrogenase
MLDGDGPVWWTVDLGIKDAGLALDVARAGDARLPLTVAASERYDAASARGLGYADVAAISLLYTGQ